jgi:hypothetical protein
MISCLGNEFHGAAGLHVEKLNTTVESLAALIGSNGEQITHRRVCALCHFESTQHVYHDCVIHADSVIFVSGI